MRTSDTAIGIVEILFGTTVFLYSTTFPAMSEHLPGPSLFPMILAALLVLCGVVLVAKGIRSGERIFVVDLSEFRNGGFRNILIVLGSVLFYILFSGYLGFLPTSFLLLSTSMKWFGATLRNSLFMAAGTTLFIYLLFGKVLLVALPAGLVGW